MPKQDAVPNQQIIIKVGHLKRADGTKAVMVNYSLPDGSVNCTFHFDADAARAVAKGHVDAANAVDSRLTLPGEGAHFRMVD